MVLIGCVAALVASLFLAHVVALRVSKRLEVKPGYAWEVMPSLPSAPPVSGRAEARWDKNLERVERRLLAEFDALTQPIEAHALAGAWGEDVALVEAVLTRMREEVACRLQITQQGRMFHTFSAEQIQQLRNKRARGWPLRALWFAVGVFANIGAIWPVVAVASIAGGALFVISATVTEGDMLNAGILGIGAILVVVVSTLIGGVLSRLLLSPLRGGPKLGDVQEAESLPRRLDRSDVHAHNAYADAPFWLWTSQSSAPMNTYHEGGGWFDRAGFSIGLPDLDDSEGGASGILIVLVVLVLAAILAASLGAIVLWIRGVWRAMKRLNEPQRNTSPTSWVRTKKRVDRFEKFIPTNDLVVRSIHALRRAYQKRRPEDDDLPARVLSIARRNQGRVSALEISLREGLDLDESTEVGARLSGLLGGQILLNDAADLVFAFPEGLYSQVRSAPEEDLWAEYLTFGSQIRRRAAQSQDTLPVNLVGLTATHIASTDRLVAGTFLMAIMGALFVQPMIEAGRVGLGLAVFLVAPLCMFAAGAATLTALVRYTAKQSAAHGVRRDVRRATMHMIHDALKQGRTQVDLGRLRVVLKRVFEPSWGGLKQSTIDAEIRSVCADLGVEPSLEQHVTSAADAHLYDLGPLLARLRAGDAHDAVFDFESAQRPSPSDDKVVFDTHIEHDHVTQLGLAR